MNCVDLDSIPMLPPPTLRWATRRRANPALTALVRIGALVVVLLAHGCAAINLGSPPESPPHPAPPATTVAAEPTATAAAPPNLPKVAQPATAVDKVTKAPVAPSVSTAQGGSIAPASSPKPQIAVSPKPQAAAPLDLKSLEIRLKETAAIGVFTKLTLKNQIDALLDRFREFHQGKLKKISLAELRRSYDMLVLKVLALLQDADPSLAMAIAASRETIWGILSNPAKFAAV